MNELEKYDNVDNSLYDVFRASCVKQYDLILEQSGKLLKMVLAAYFASNRQADRLVFKDVFRHAALHDLIDTDSVERWIKYRDHRNDTVHNYGDNFAEVTLKLLPEFIIDAKNLAKIIDESNA